MNQFAAGVPGVRLLFLVSRYCTCLKNKKEEKVYLFILSTGAVSNGIIATADAAKGSQKYQ